MLARRAAKSSPLLSSKAQSASARAYFSATTARCADFTHVVIGGGVVGIAVARQLAQRSSGSTLASTSDREALAKKTEAWIDECLAVEGLDEGIKTVLEHTKGSLTEEAE
ncbi:hypothetical protein NLG97_g2367 [Lecanicillium saksenae]|uniref:Uncharacterized protein n=1 Tax=Lecanicillium saksenae TaxID=468837 RepID=A0ACC1R3T6_9HYPO|nr:hypothetical protein NLG97_g2367 [Lecanicillium saksenae]